MSATNLGFISEAYNDEALKTGINAQTGSFQASITLAEISAGIQFPASFSLNLIIGQQTLPRVSSMPGQDRTLLID